MKVPKLNTRHPPASLVVLITLATVLMYLVALGVTIPDGNGIAFITIVCACILIFILMVILALPAIVDEFHKAIMEWEEREHRYRTRRADRERYYAYRRRMRKLELERRMGELEQKQKQYQRKNRYPAYQYQPRRVRITQRPKDPTDYGC
ncbi:MAG: hypothetical protein ACYDER_22820 [Ktedonobacteraceae bacterium]